MAWDPAFETAFNPSAIAIAGAAREQPGGSPLGGTAFIVALQQLGYPGKIYPINPKAPGEIRGLKCYPSLSSLPEPVDLVISSVPRAALPDLLRECVSTGNKNIHVFTSGFEETGTEEGRRLAKTVRDIAEKGGLRMVGPNCMGLCYIPKARVTVWEGVAPQPGSVAFISQSGGHSGEFCRSGPRMGVFFSKVISFGNAYVMDSTDFLEYFAKDPETSIVTMYLEGVKDGRKLFRQVQELNSRKPVIIWKGGLTNLGARAVSSHTASLGGERAIWDAFFKQTGAVRANSIDEIADATLAFLYLPPPRGRRVAVVVGGGGNSVATADICSADGLDLPVLSLRTQEALRRFVPESGNSIRNPVDAITVYRSTQNLEKAVEAIYNDPSVDTVVLALNLSMTRGQQDTNRRWDENVEFLCRFVRENPEKKPLAAVLSTWGDPKVLPLMEALRKRLLDGGIPVFASLARASRSLARFVGYHEFYRERGITVSYKPLASRVEVG